MRYILHSLRALTTPNPRYCPRYDTSCETYQRSSQQLKYYAVISVGWSTNRSTHTLEHAIRPVLYDRHIPIDWSVESGSPLHLNTHKAAYIQFAFLLFSSLDSRRSSSSSRPAGAHVVPPGTTPRPSKSHPGIPPGLPGGLR